MSYTIHIDYSDLYSREEIINLTTEVLWEDKKLAKKLLDIDEEVDDIELLDESIEESTWPIASYMHILQYRPSEKTIKELAKLTLVVVVVYIPELEAYGLMLTSAGMDLSAHLELAYRLLDGESPIEADFLGFLNEKAKNKLLELREKQKKC